MVRHRRPTHAGDIDLALRVGIQKKKTDEARARHSQEAKCPSDGCQRERMGSSPSAMLRSRSLAQVLCVLLAWGCSLYDGPVPRRDLTPPEGEARPKATAVRQVTVGCAPEDQAAASTGAGARPGIGRLGRTSEQRRRLERWHRIGGSRAVHSLDAREAARRLLRRP
jgi:hypothetical protein